MTLPNRDYIPPHITKLFSDTIVPFPVVFYFTDPESGIRLRNSCITAALMSVPEAAVHENHGPVLRKNNVGTSRQPSVILSEPQPFSEKVASYHLLRPCIPGSYPGHIVMPLFCCKDIHLYSSVCIMVCLSVFRSGQPPGETGYLRLLYLVMKLIGDSLYSFRLSLEILANVSSTITPISGILLKSTPRACTRRSIIA